MRILSNELITICIAERGAELQSIRDSSGTEYLWQGDARYWADRAPNLFPFVARLWEKKYLLDGKLYTMPIHGFAMESKFAVREHTSDRVVLELTDNEKTYAAFPRAFAFRVCYTLSNRTLLVRYEVENRDKRILYCGLGGHPGFRVPLETGESFSDYRLHFDAPEGPVRVGFTPDCFPDGTNIPFPLTDDTDIPLRHDLFCHDAIVLKHTGHRVMLVDGKGTTRIQVDYPDMDILGLWHMPHTDAPYLCIEPWCSLPARHGEVTVFETKSDLLKVKPEETVCREWSVTV